MVGSKTIVFFILRLLISLTLMAFVLYRTDIGEISRILTSVSLMWLIPAFLAHVFGVAVEAWRWWMLLQSRAVKVNRWEMAKLLLGARFLNLFLPGSMGGDAYRICGTYKQAASMLQATGIVLLERLLGFLAAVAVGLALLPFSSMFQQHPSSFWFLAGGFAGIIFAVILLGNRLFAELTAAILKRCRMDRLSQVSLRISTAVASFRRAKMLLVKLVALSGLMKLAVAIQIYLLAHSLGIAFGVADLMVFLPLHIIATSLPISINSIGVREANLVAFFIFAGYDGGQATSVALLLMFWIYATSIPCVLFLFRWRDVPCASTSIC